MIYIVCISQDHHNYERQTENVNLTDIDLGGLTICDPQPGDERKNSSSSMRAVASTPKYTECMAADKPFASINNRRMVDNITRAVSTTHLFCRFSLKVLRHPNSMCDRL